MCLECMEYVESRELMLAFWFGVLWPAFVGLIDPLF